MKATTFELLKKITNTELVEVSGEVFDKVKASQGDVRSLDINDTSGERSYTITYYIVDGNIIGSWEHFSGLVRLEKSLLPEREEGWYRVKIGGEYLVAQYGGKCKMFFIGEDYFEEESDFEWVDDKPIKFPEE